MTGAMYAAISGLKAHMNKLNVIGNNIANVNTYGYKTQRYVFHEALYTTSRYGSEGTTRTGGLNPSQVGYGSVTGTIDLDMTTGNYVPGKSSDVMINGDGFFLVGDKDLEVDPLNASSLKNFTLTRVGDLSFKSDGYYSNQEGSVIYGFLNKDYDKDGKPVICDQLVPIRYPRMYEQTEEYTVQDYISYFKLNIGEEDLSILFNGTGGTDGYTLKFEGQDYDELNNKKPFEDAWKAIDATKADPSVKVELTPLADIKSVDDLKTMDDVRAFLLATQSAPMTIQGSDPDNPKERTVVADSNDPPQKVCYNLTEQFHLKGSAILPKIFDLDDPDLNPHHLKKEQLAPEIAELEGKLIDGGAVISNDGQKLINNNPYLNVDSITVDNKSGRISCITKETDEEVIIGYIAVGNVTNPDGVTNTGGPNYKAMDGAGELSIGLLSGSAEDLGIVYVNGSTVETAKKDPVTGNAMKDSYDAQGNELFPAGSRIGNAGTTEFVTGGLELSKTDLATEIAEMISTQRGYQANTRIVTVTDSMLEELVNMKR